jgi:hypothetical protein
LPAGPQPPARSRRPSSRARRRASCRRMSRWGSGPVQGRSPRTADARATRRDWNYLRVTP